VAEEEAAAVGVAVAVVVEAATGVEAAAGVEARAAGEEVEVAAIRRPPRPPLEHRACLPPRRCCFPASHRM